MKSLIIDTSTQEGMVGVADEGELLLYHLLPTDLNNSTSIMPAIDSLFDKLQLSHSDMDFITLGIGPGSYTGIRVAAAIGKGIAYALQIPVVPVSSLFAFLPEEEGSYTVLLDARVSGVYHLTATVKEGEVVYASEPAAVAISNLEPLLSTCSNIATPHAAALQKKIEKAHPLLSLEWHQVAPHPWYFAKKGFTDLPHVSDSHIELLYLRKTQAELEKEEKLERS